MNRFKHKLYTMLCNVFISIRDEYWKPIILGIVIETILLYILNSPK